MSCTWLTFPPELYPLHKRIKITLSDSVFIDEDDTTYIHKRGFPTDGASIPNFLTVIWDPFDRQIIRSVIQHDIQYTLHDFSPTFKQRRPQVDRRFLRSLRCEKWSCARLWYINVRLFGEHIWNEMSKDPDALAWYEATQKGDEAIDEWIRKCKENPRRLEKVKYYDHIQKDKLRSFNRAYKDLKGLGLWIFSDEYLDKG